jgi:hypothetical protein
VFLTLTGHAARTTDRATTPEHHEEAAA